MNDGVKVQKTEVSEIPVEIFYYIKGRGNGNDCDKGNRFRGKVANRQTFMYKWIVPRLVQWTLPDLTQGFKYTTSGSGSWSLTLI